MRLPKPILRRFDGGTENVLPEVIITPDPNNQALIQRGAELIPNKLLRYDLAVANTNTNSGVNSNRLYSNLLDLYQASGSPDIHLGASHSGAPHSKGWYKWKNFWNKLGLAKNYQNEYNRYYRRSYTNITPKGFKGDIHISSPSLFYPELSHAYQQYNDFMDTAHQSESYEHIGSDEYNAHHGIEPAMYDYAYSNKRKRNMDYVHDYILSAAPDYSRRYSYDIVRPMLPGVRNIALEYRNSQNRAWDPNNTWYNE